MMKKPLILLYIVMLIFSIRINAMEKHAASCSYYWVAETGPRSNPYTIIRLYDGTHKALTEISMSGFRLRVNSSMKKKLTRLTAATPLEDPEKIAVLLGIRPCRITSVKKNG
ncbi:hypothetical protein LQ567_10845 [Niabella pedocola]|uniref:Uncharacterized protein n=1 Tax=Niabella pedocola TaxID=1752077 RepID=A0ABS8PQ83_9BACT|nr:hypothetical protein [Niabella pedocola]MCD2423258.1 hypothetical protein [Niabella pedocola]